MMKRKESQPKANHGSVEREVDVLYQKMGDRWYAFSLVDDEIFFGSIPQEEISVQSSQRTKETRKKRHNSPSTV